MKPPKVQKKGLKMSEHLTTQQLEAGMEHVLQSPADVGALLKIVRRPDVDRREVLQEGELDAAEGLVGDNWKTRGSSSTADGAAHPEAQLTLINARLISLVAQSEERWQLSGDQLVVDMDLSVDNLPVGTRLSMGSAILEVTAKPHTGCGKFSSRFGKDALRLTATPQGRALRLRGMYTRVVQPGTVRVGDAVAKVAG